MSDEIKAYDVENLENVEDDDLGYELLESDVKNSKAMAITRLIVALVTIINVIAGAFGWEPLGLDGELVYNVVSGILAIVAIIWAWWKNNNISRAAMYGQYVTNNIKESL